MNERVTRQKHKGTTKSSLPEILRKKCPAVPDGGEKRGRRLVRPPSYHIGE